MLILFRHILLIAGCFFLLGNAVSAADPRFAGEATWIYDGDTLEVQNVGTVRLLGIDTPERDSSVRDHFFRKWGISPKRLRQISKEALKFNIAEVKGRPLTLVPDGDQKDKYGRLLAYVYLPDGQMLNRILLRKGLAVVYRRFDFQQKGVFMEDEAKARREGVGLWHWMD